MKKLTSTLLIISIVILVLVIIATCLVVLRGDEDGWICAEGGWIKHGNPTVSQPTSICQKARACTMEAKICPDGSSVGRQGRDCQFAPCPTTSTTTTSTVGLANPASVNCKKLGGDLVMKKRGDGGEYGLCFFEDNRACEEWALLRGDCPFGGMRTTGYDNDVQKYCAWLGGSTITEPNASCTFKDGSTCPNAKLYNGTCNKGEVLK